MNLQTDINWIKAEISNVREPHLIEAIKQMLAYHNSKSTGSFFSTSKTDLKVRAEASLKSIVKGNTRSLSSFINDVELWKAQ